MSLSRIECIGLHRMHRLRVHSDMWGGYVPQGLTAVGSMDQNGRAKQLFLDRSAKLSQFAHTYSTVLRGLDTLENTNPFWIPSIPGCPCMFVEQGQLLP